jgi:hypothetical protein
MYMTRNRSWNRSWSRNRNHIQIKCRNRSRNRNRLQIFWFCNPGYQDVTLFCCFPTQTTAKNIPKCRCHRQRCPSTIIAACAPTTSAPTTSAPTDSAQPAYTPPTADSPPPKSPPAKRTRKRRCEVELLRDREEDSSLLLLPLSYETSSPSVPASMPPPSP